MQAAIEALVEFSRERGASFKAEAASRRHSTSRFASTIVRATSGARTTTETGRPSISISTGCGARVRKRRSRDARRSCESYRASPRRTPDDVRSSRTPVPSPSTRCYSRTTRSPSSRRLSTCCLTETLKIVRRSRSGEHSHRSSKITLTTSGIRATCSEPTTTIPVLSTHVVGSSALRSHHPCYAIASSRFDVEVVSSRGDRELRCRTSTTMTPRERSVAIALARSSESTRALLVRNAARASAGGDARADSIAGVVRQHADDEMPRDERRDARDDAARRRRVEEIGEEHDQAAFRVATPQVGEERLVIRFFEDGLEIVRRARERGHVRGPPRRGLIQSTGLPVKATRPTLSSASWAMRATDNPAVSA